MSDTPRTDALAQEWDGNVKNLWLELREFERENAELRGDLEEALFERDEVKRVRYSLEDALTRSQAEAEAFWVKKDQLACAAEEVLRTYINVVRVTGHPCPEDLVICRKLRAAIDAARSKEAQP